PAVLSGALFLSSGSTPQIPKENLLPDLAHLLPFLPSWRILTDVSIISVLALVVVFVTRYVLYHTPFGLRLRAVGENPEAADAAGVAVNRMRYVGVIMSGALAGIGGAYLSIGQSSLFTRNMAAGRGFIALAALIFGKWRPVQTMLACLLFGFADALTIQMQGVAKLPSGEDVPVQFIQMIPYVVTIVVLAGFIGRSRAPTWERVEEAAAAIRARCGAVPDVAVVLGSGLGGFAGTLLDSIAIAYTDLPHWPAAKVVGHDGRLVVGSVAGKRIAALAGRAHFYEGYDLGTVVFATRVMGRLGVKQIILTNAAGGINTAFTAGALMIIDDHLNLLGSSPLIGANDERFGPRFPDMTEVYSSRLRAIADEVAQA